MVAAIILAAGESRRMDFSHKANLSFKGRTFLETIVDTFKKGGIEKIYVVVGKDAESVIARNSELDVAYLHNMDYKKGQLSSLHVALDVISRTVSDIIVHPVDHPLILPKTVRELIEQRRSTGFPIIIPIHRGKRGHPVLFGRELFDQLRTAPQDVGARSVVWENRDKICEIPTEDHGIVVNINTFDAYMQWCSE